MKKEIEKLHREPRDAASLLERQASIVADCEDAIISISLEGEVLTWNRGATTLFGFAPEDMVGRSIKLIIPPERHSEEDSILRQITAGQVVKPFDTLRVRIDGSLVDVSLTVSPVKAPDGTIIAASKVARDVTAKKRLDEARRRLVECSKLVGERFYEGIVEALADTLQVRWVLLCDLDPAQRSRARTLGAWADGALQANFEYDLPGTPCENVLEDRICFYPTDVAQLFPGDALLAEMGADSYLGVPLRAGDGRTLGLLAVLHDGELDQSLQPQETLELFAGRAAAELERAAAASINERFGRIIEDAAGEVFVFDAETLRFELVNRGARENLGYSMDELAGLTPVDIKPRLDRRAFEALIEPL